MSFVTTANKVYACGVGITATAGTNLTLHMLGANVYRTQSQDEAGFPERHAGQIVSTSQSL